MSNSEIFSLLGILLTIVIQSFAMIKYLLAVTNNGDKELHGRIDEVKDNYVKRSDLDRDLTSINSTLDSIREDMKYGINQIQEAQKQQSSDINKRFDIMAGSLLRAVNGTDK